MILNLFYPEIFLSFSILFQLILNAQVVNNVSYNFPILNKELFSQTIFILFCLLILFINLKVENFFYNFMFVIDKSSRLIKITFIFVCIFSLIFIYKAFCLQKLNFFEFYVILLITILSSLLLICSYDLLTIYLLLEMQALCFYILASFKRNSAFSTEAGLKYFIFGSIILKMATFFIFKEYLTLVIVEIFFVFFILKF
jgi:NADH-quinone oxidoreductase subunit N